VERTLLSNTLKLFDEIRLSPLRSITIPKPSLRVLITAGQLRYGGSAFVIRSLAQALRKRGVLVRISTLSTVVNLRETRKLLEMVDVVHNHVPIINWLTLITDVPLVYHDHGAPDVNSFDIRFSYGVAMRLFAHRVAKVICVSEFGRQDLRRRFGITNAQTVYNGVDLHRFKSALQSRFRIGNPQLLFVGNLHPHKNVQEVVFATKLLSRILPQVKLSIVGKGSDYHTIRKTAIDLGISDSIRFWGRVGDDELPYHYSSCDVYVSPSKWEYFGMPLLESMACGKPIVASSIPAHLELLRGSHAGLSYESGNAYDLASQVLKAVRHPEAFEEAGIAYAQHYDWPLVADRVIDLYRQIVTP